jgi:hypothetical protein
MERIEASGKWQVASGKAAALFIKYNIRVIKFNMMRWMEFVA